MHADQGQFCVHPPRAIGTAGAVVNGGDRLARPGAQIVEKVPTTKRSRRVIDIDPGTAAVLRGI